MLLVQKFLFCHVSVLSTCTLQQNDTMQPNLYTSANVFGQLTIYIVEGVHLHHCIIAIAMLPF